MEEKYIESEVARRVEELVTQRVEVELEKRKDEIETEVGSICFIVIFIYLIVIFELNVC